MTIFEKTTLGNGIRVVTAPFPQVGSLSFVMLAAGSQGRDARVEGHLHFAEHMFQGHGAASHRAHDLDGDRRDRRRVQRLHGQGAHRLLRPMGSETRDTALDVLADMLLHSRFDEAEITKEKA